MTVDVESQIAAYARWIEDRSGAPMRRSAAVAAPTPVLEPLSVDELDTLIEMTPSGGGGHGRVRWLTLAACAALVVGGLVFLADRSASEPAASATTPAPTASTAPTTSSLPPTAGVTGDGRGDRWTTAVQDVLDQLGWKLAGTEYSADGGNIFGGSVVAEVGDGRIVFDVQTYADGEYSTDPNWQMEVAGSNTPGTAVPEGTLFLTEETATAVRRAIVVSPSAIVMVHAEFVATSDLPDIATFETAARQLAARLPDVLGNDN